MALELGGFARRRLNTFRSSHGFQHLSDLFLGVPTTTTTITTHSTATTITTHSTALQYTGVSQPYGGRIRPVLDPLLALPITGAPCDAPTRNRRHRAPPHIMGGSRWGGWSWREVEVSGGGQWWRCVTFALTLVTRRHRAPVCPETHRSNRGAALRPARSNGASTGSWDHDRHELRAREHRLTRAPSTTLPTTPPPPSLS